MCLLPNLNNVLKERGEKIVIFLHLSVEQTNFFFFFSRKTKKKKKSSQRIYYTFEKSKEFFIANEN